MRRSCFIFLLVVLIISSCEKDNTTSVNIPDQIINGDSLILNLSEYFHDFDKNSVVYSVTDKSEPFAITTNIVDNMLILKCISSYLSSGITITATSGSDQRTAEFEVSGSRHNELIQGIAEVNGIELYYEVAGSGIPIVFIHIFPLDCRSWNYQLDQFAQHYKVIRYDLVGYGKSANPNSGNKYRDNLKGLLDYLDVSAAHICGACVGSAIAIDFCLGYPEYCRSIISVGAWAWGHDSQATREAFNVTDIANEMSVENGKSAALEYLIKGNPIFQNAIQNVETQVILMEIGSDYSWWDATHSHNGAVEEHAIEKLESITKPTLVITSEYDITPSKEVAEIMDSDIENSTLVNIDDAGHFMWLDKPTEFNQIVLSFLETETKSSK